MAALDEGCSGSIQQALFREMYTICEAAAKDPSHDLGGKWLFLRIRELRDGPNHARLLPRAPQSSPTTEREPVFESTKKLLAPPKKSDQKAGDGGIHVQVRAAVRSSQAGRAKGERR